MNSVVINSVLIPSVHINTKQIELTIIITALTIIFELIDKLRLINLGNQRAELHPTARDRAGIIIIVPYCPWGQRKNIFIYKSCKSHIQYRSRIAQHNTKHIN